MKIDRDKLVTWAKFIGAAVVTRGVMTLCDQAIENNTPEDAQGYKKFCVGAAGLVLTGMAINAVTKEVNNAVDGAVKVYDNVVEGVEKAKESEGEQVPPNENSGEQEVKCE